MKKKNEKNQVDKRIMNTQILIRQILSTSREFKAFWEKQGPFRYALTSNEFPPVLMEPEEWIFSDDLEALLKSLMQFEAREMEIVPFPFNPDKKSILRPDAMIPWRIINFPEEWSSCGCDCFMPGGHLTHLIFQGLSLPDGNLDSGYVEKAFFHCLSNCTDQLGYLLFKPIKNSKTADMKKYLTEWEEDDQDAGLI